jgi:hypothetical protein
MNTEYVIAAIEGMVDAKVNGTSVGVRQAQKELRKALNTPPSWMANEADLAPCAAKLKVDFEEDLPKSRYVTFLYEGHVPPQGDSRPTRRMIQVLKDEYGVISGIDVDKDEYRTFSKLKIIGNIEEIV